MADTGSPFLSYFLLSHLPARQKENRPMPVEPVFFPRPLRNLHPQSRSAVSVQTVQATSSPMTLLEAIRGKGRLPIKTNKLTDRLRQIESNRRRLCGQIRSHFGALLRQIASEVREIASKFCRLTHPKPLNSHYCAGTKDLVSFFIRAWAQQ